MSQLGTTHFPRPCMLFTAAHIFRTGQNSIRVPILAAKPFPEIPWEWWLPKILEERTCWIPFASVSFLCFVEDILALTWNRSRISLVSRYRYYVHSLFVCMNYVIFQQLYTPSRLPVMGDPNFLFLFHPVHVPKIFLRDLWHFSQKEGDFLQLMKIGHVQCSSTFASSNRLAAIRGPGKPRQRAVRNKRI